MIPKDKSIKYNFVIFVHKCPKVYNRLSNGFRYNLKFVEKTHDSDTERSERAQSETTDPDSDLEEEDFVEALESLDLNEPQHMQKYTNFLEPLVTTADANPSRMT